MEKITHVQTSVNDVQVTLDSTVCNKLVVIQDAIETLQYSLNKSVCSKLEDLQEKSVETCDKLDDWGYKRLPPGKITDLSHAMRL